MATSIGETVDPQWEEIALRLDPLPTVLTAGTKTCPFDPPRRVVVLAGNYTSAATAAAAKLTEQQQSIWGNDDSGGSSNGFDAIIRHGIGSVGGCNNVQCGTRLCGANNTCSAQVAGDGMMDVLAWPVFPGEAVSLASPEMLQQTMRDTLRLSAEWGQGNSFCSIFSQAARVRMPVDLWMPKWRTAIRKFELTCVQYVPTSVQPYYSRWWWCGALGVTYLLSLWLCPVALLCNICRTRNPFTRPFDLAVNRELLANLCMHLMLWFDWKRTTCIVRQKYGGVPRGWWDGGCRRSSSSCRLDVAVDNHPWDSGSHIHGVVSAQHVILGHAISPTTW
jgi:hypothetical protein